MRTEKKNSCPDLFLVGNLMRVLSSRQRRELLRYRSISRRFTMTLTTILQYGLYDRPELTTWHKGRVVLLGDAAHPTTPVTGYYCHIVHSVWLASSISGKVQIKHSKTSIISYDASSSIIPTPLPTSAPTHSVQFFRSTRVYVFSGLRCWSKKPDVKANYASYRTRRQGRKEINLWKNIWPARHFLTLSILLLRGLLRAIVKFRAYAPLKQIYPLLTICYFQTCMPGK